MMIIEDLGRQLANKPFEWMSWWWGIKWGVFIEIFPQLSKENPLWLREPAELEHLRLFRKTPDQLQLQIASYWQKPSWRRWLLRLFTDINGRIVIWSYYQRCLSFQRIHQNSSLERRLIQYEPEQRLVNLLMNELIREHTVLEQRLESHIGDVEWMEKNLDSILTHHEEKTNQIFLKLLNRYLKELPVDCSRDSVQRKLEEEYSELQRILREYFIDWCQFSFKKGIEANSSRDLVYVGPTEVKRVVSPAISADHSSPSSSLNEWLDQRQHILKEKLKENPIDYDEIQAFLQQCLQNWEGLVESLLLDFEILICDAKHQRVDYKQALDYSEHLQSRFSYFFRHSSLLFHPDKSDGNPAICQIKTELFQYFHPLAEISYERLNQGVKILKQYVPSGGLGFDKIVEKIEQDLRSFREEFDKKCVEIEAQHVEISEQQAELRAQHTKLDEELNETKLNLNLTKVRQAEMDMEVDTLKDKNAEINKTLEMLLKRTSAYKDSKNEIGSSESTTNAQLFRR